MPQLPARELTRSFTNRYRNSMTGFHSTFSKGMLRDIPSWETPEGFCWDAADFLFDTAGKARKRGGWTAPAVTSRTAAAEFLTGYRSGDIDQRSSLFASLGKGGPTFGLVDRTTGAASMTGISANDVIAGKPFQYQNWMFAPFVAKGNTSSDYNVMFAFGGDTLGSVTGITAGTVTAGSSSVTGLTGASFAANHAGAIIVLQNAGGGNIYIGRVIAVLGLTSVQVSPTPTIPFTVTSGTAVQYFNPQFNISGYSALPSLSGKYGVGYQGRIVLANVARTPAGITASPARNPYPFRVWWSNEQSDALSTGVFAHEDGDASLFPGFFSQYNYVDIPEVGRQGITGLAVAGEGDLVVFGADTTFRITGELTTETTLNPSFSFTVQQVSSNVGCIEARSIQYTRQGLIFAGKENLFLFDGSQMRPLLSGTNENYYQQRIQQGDVILGSAWLGNQNHYYLSMSGSDAGLLFNMDGLEMGRITNTSIMDGTRDPDDPTKVWGLKFWNTASTAPSQVAGQLMQLDSMFRPTASNTADGDTVGYFPTFVSKSYVDGETLAQKRFTHVKFGYDLRYVAGVATVTAQVDTKLNSSDATWVSLPSTLPETGTAAGEKGFRILPITTKGLALQFRLVLTACDSFELLSVQTELQELPLGEGVVTIDPTGKTSDPGHLPITAPTIQRVRELMKGDLKRAADSFTSDADPRYQLAIPTYLNGARVATPKIDTGYATVTSTGAFGGYTITFTAPFTASPGVVAWSSITSGSAFTHLSLASISSSGFGFSIEEFGPGQAVVPAGQTFIVSWIAIGA